MTITIEFHPEKPDGLAPAMNWQGCLKDGNSEGFARGHSPQKVVDALMERWIERKIVESK